MQLAHFSEESIEAQVVEPLLQFNNIKFFQLKSRAAQFLQVDTEFTNSEMMLLQELEIINHIWSSGSDNFY